MSASPTSAPPVTARPRTFLPLRAILCAAALGLVLGASSEARRTSWPSSRSARGVPRAELRRRGGALPAAARPEKPLVKDPAVLAQAGMVWGAVLFARASGTTRRPCLSSSCSPSRASSPTR